MGEIKKRVEPFVLIDDRGRACYGLRVGGVVEHVALDDWLPYVATGSYAFVHGYNSAHADVWARVWEHAGLSMMVPNDVPALVPILWGSRGRGTAYFKDRRAAGRAAKALRATLEALASMRGPVGVLSHSMGAYVVWRALIVKEVDMPLIRDWRMVAPDLASVHLTGRRPRRVRRLRRALVGGRATVYHARQDKALALSNTLRHFLATDERMGRRPAPIEDVRAALAGCAVAYVDCADAAAVLDPELAHTYLFGCGGLPGRVWLHWALGLSGPLPDPARVRLSVVCP